MTVLTALNRALATIVHAVVALALVYGPPTSAHGARAPATTAAMQSAAGLLHPRPVRPSRAQHKCCACHPHQIALPMPVATAAVVPIPLAERPLRIAAAVFSPGLRPLRPPIA